MKNLMEIELIANFLASKTLSDALQDKNLWAMGCFLNAS